MEPETLFLPYHHRLLTPGPGDGPRKLLPWQNNTVQQVYRKYLGNRRKSRERAQATALARARIEFEKLLTSAPR